MTKEQLSRVALDETRYEIDSETGCWNWKRARLRSGHAQVRIAGVCVVAHRVFYEYFVGPILPGLVAHHTCLNPGCVNPTHIQPVTHAHHMRLHAEQFGKLNWESAEEVRSLWSTGKLTQAEIARQFGVDHSTVSRVVRNETWIRAGRETVDTASHAAA